MTTQDAGTIESDVVRDGPLVSIGLPVRNGGQYLEASIRSLLGQTYRNIELVICDNVSSDDTQEICERFAAEDPRVRYFRNEVDVGGAGNHNLVFEKSVGEYFRWGAHDDIAEPELIERCVEILEANPAVVNCHCDVVHIDEHGEITGTVSRNHGASERPSERFAAVAGARDYLEEVYGVMRRDALATTNLHQEYTASDRTLMSEVALGGQFYNIEQQLFRKRLHPGNEYIDWRGRMAWFGKKYEGKIVLPWWSQLFDYIRTIRRVPLARSERIRCGVYMLTWVFRNSLKLAKDLALALAGLLRLRGGRKRRNAAVQNWS